MVNVWDHDGHPICIVVAQGERSRLNLPAVMTCHDGIWDLHAAVIKARALRNFRGRLELEMMVMPKVPPKLLFHAEVGN